MIKKKKTRSSTTKTTAKKKMTSKQKIFADEWIKDPNATKAAIMAGYSEKTAAQIGQENLRKPVILDYIKEAMEKRDKKAVASADEILEFLTNTMRGEVNDKFGLEPQLSDRIKAAEMLGKRHMLWVDKTKVDMDVKANIDVAKELELARKKSGADDG